MQYLVGYVVFGRLWQDTVGKVVFGRVGAMVG